MRLYLPRNSPQYKYAQLLWNGVEMDAALIEVGATQRQGYRWQQKWRKRAKEMAGRNVNVIYALRLICEGFEKQEG